VVTRLLGGVDAAVGDVGLDVHNLRAGFVT
jgi:hypothetical protein